MYKDDIMHIHVEKADGEHYIFNNLAFTPRGLFVSTQINCLCIYFYVSVHVMHNVHQYFVNVKIIYESM